jgi:ATP-dependent RNA helicase DHX36
MHLFVVQGFTYPVRAHFLEDVLEITGYKLTSFNQVDDYGQDKLWKTQKQLAPRKRKNQITALVEVCSCIKNLVLILLKSLNDI